MPSSQGQLSGNALVHGELGERLHLYLSRMTPFGFSGSVLVAKGEQILLSQGYGFADRERRVSNRPDSVFDIGSLTKQFTAAAILKLEEMGKLRVEDRISNYLENLPEDKAGITIHQLLTHSAGLTDLLLDDDGEYDADAYDYSMKTQAQFLVEALQTGLLWEPGTKYRYSNIGYGLLGVIVERLSGQSYDRFLENQFFNPLGMKATGTHLPEWNPDGLAVGYRGGKRWGTALEREMASDGPSWNLRAAGGILSTVEDLHRWIRALQSCQVLKKSSVDKLFSPHIPENAAGTYHYGYGWSISRRGSGTTRVSHSGSNGIFYADLHQYIEDGLNLIFLTNSYDDTTELIVCNLSRLIFGEDSVPFPPAIEGPTPIPGLEGLAGTYYHPEIGPVDVSIEAGLLIMEPYGQRALEVFAANEPEKVDYYRLLNDHSKEIVAGFNRGDYRTLEKFTEAARFQRLVSFLKGYWKPEWGKEKDARKSQVLGTMAEVWRDAGRAASFVRTGEGKPFFQILWKGVEVVGFSMGSAVHPARTRFIPVESLDFPGFHPGTGKTISIRFKTGEDGEGKQFWAGDLPVPWTKTADK